MGFNLPPIKIVLGVGTFDLSQLIKLKQGCLKSITVQVTFIGKDRRVFVIPTGTTAKVRMLKPDQKKVLDDTEHDGIVEGNVVKFEITDQMQAYPGRGALEIILFNGGETVTSSTCGIEIIDNVHNDSGIESTDEWLTVLNTLAVLEEKIQDANEAIDNANDAAQELINETLLIYKPNVANYSTIATTYPTPEIGWATVANDTKIRWRYNGTAWINSGTVTTDPIATENTPGNVQGNGNVSIKPDGAMWSNQYKDKATATGTSVQFTDADDALISITSMSGTGSVTVVATGKNIFNKDETYTHDKALASSTGAENANTSSDISPYIKVNPTSAYGLSLASWTTVRVVCFYDVNKTFISGIAGTSVYNFTTPSNAHYIRFNFSDTIIGSVQLETGATTAYEAYHGNQLTIPDVTTAVYPLYLTSYKGITNVFTLSTAQPTFTAVAKSELWANNYNLHNGDITASVDTITADTEIVKGKLSWLIGVIKYKLSTLATAVAGKVNTADKATTDTENNTNKWLAANVGYSLGQESDALKTRLDKIMTGTLNLVYADSSTLHESVYLSGAITCVTLTMRNTAGTPFDNVTRLYAGPNEYTTGRLDVYAKGSGFVSGHVLQVDYIAFIF